MSRWTPEAVDRLSREVRDALHAAEEPVNRYGYDPFGFHPDSAHKFYLGAALLYRYYFRVEVHDIDRVPKGPVILIANHAGQFAYDGAMLSVAMLLLAKPPRMCRGMGEYFLWKVPWMGIAASRMGTLVGTPDNCVAALRGGACVMVFPEGARGANKPFHRRYKLQEFGRGFLRLALETGAPIVPVGIVGSEEQQPGFANLESIGRAVGLPSLPLTISQPWFGPLGAVFALPTKYRLHFGEPLFFEGDAYDEDARIDERVDRVKESVADLLAQGLRERTGVFR